MKNAIHYLNGIHFVLLKHYQPWGANFDHEDKLSFKIILCIHGIYKFSSANLADIYFLLYVKELNELLSLNA